MDLDRNLLFKAAAEGLIPLFVRSTETAELSDDDQTMIEKPYTSVIASTAAPDRYGDIVIQQGWQLENFKANPVIQPWHKYDTPSVGRGENIRLVELNDNQALAMNIVWDLGLPLGATLARQYKEGFARGVSVGFRPLNYSARSDLPDTDPRKSKTGMVIHTAELLELSTAPVPVQQEALAARALGVGFSAAGGQTSEISGLCALDIVEIIRQAIDTDPMLRKSLINLLNAHKLSQPEPRSGFDFLADWLTD